MLGSVVKVIQRSCHDSVVYSASVRSLEARATVKKEPRVPVEDQAQVVQATSANNKDVTRRANVTGPVYVTEKKGQKFHLFRTCFGLSNANTVKAFAPCQICCKATD